MYPKLYTFIDAILGSVPIEHERNELVQPLIYFIQDKVNKGLPIDLNFICTHNSRRSHLCQIWMQVAASYYDIPKLRCYSGGTQQTALYPMVATVLKKQGLNVFKITETQNPIYAIKSSDNAVPIICFSKKYEDTFNPSSGYAAVLTCSQADHGCPFIVGAEKRIPITYEDPKAFDTTKNQEEGYFKRSFEIAREMFYILSQIKK
ncbi:arsenate-mycothiol transferase ArsC [Myroides sp. LJL115]